MSSTTELISQCLNDLGKENFKLFKKKLHSINHKRYNKIPYSSLEEADRLKTTNLIEAAYAEDAVVVTIEALEKADLHGKVSILRKELKRKSATEDESVQAEYSLSQMEEFARKNSVSLIKKLEEKVGVDRVVEEKQFLKSRTLKENWLLDWKIAKRVSTRLDIPQDFHWELVKELLFKKVSEFKTREENEQETKDEEKAVTDKQATNDQSCNSDAEFGVYNWTTYTQDVQNDVDSGQGNKQHAKQEEQQTESPAGNKNAGRYKVEAQENERKAKNLIKWLDHEVEKASNTTNARKEEIKTKIKSNIEFIDTWEHKTYRCLVAHKCILYTSIITGEQRLIELEKSAFKCLTTKGEPRVESKFKWQYYMWMFGGIRNIDVVFCDRDSDEIIPYKYNENWFKNFHTEFPKFLDEQILPVIALYKEAQKENNFRFLESDMQ
ncbi:uncharacterized protein LOC114648748 isoform X2 [Erpetoichthys calabaricus]|uniref:uncharacterized protein LOC114648748 isoform X2 n=1 Tax=Erpetoichthys calabaricus TaxID=27687 RepID=UPI0010A06FB0|nr:uncharacterized protein LOC114648748 isoform X2 [Erpetoichthys calabaricus]